VTDAPRVAMILINNTSLGGAERRYAQLYAQLCARGRDVSLIVNRSLWTMLSNAGLATATPALILEEPIGAVSKRLRKLDYLLGMIAVGRWIVRNRPEVLHLILGGAYLALPSQWLRVSPPSIVSVTGPFRGMVPPGGRALYRQALHRARVVEALSDGVAETVRQEGLAPDRIAVPPGTCIDIDRFRPGATRRPWVVFTGRFISEKNPLLFVEAAARVRDRLGAIHPDLRFFMLGDGPLRDEVRRLVRRFNLESATEIGWRDRPEEILSEATVFVSLQRTDNYPSQALLEAMACGMAAVANDVGQTARIVDEHVGARVKLDPDAVADAIVALLGDPARASDCGRQARERVVREHSFSAYLDHLERLYRLAAEPATPMGMTR